MRSASEELIPIGQNAWHSPHGSPAAPPSGSACYHYQHHHNNGGGHRHDHRYYDDHGDRSDSPVRSILSYQQQQQASSDGAAQDNEGELFLRYDGVSSPFSFATRDSSNREDDSSRDTMESSGNENSALIKSSPCKYPEYRH